MRLAEVTPYLTLFFSISSCILTLIALLALYLLLDRKEFTIRTRLIFNLLFSEFLNSLNNSISGIYALFQPLESGVLCSLNGFFGQLTVQASDLSALVIAIVTFLVLRTDSSHSFDHIMQVLDANTFWILLSIWFYPVITAITGFYTVQYGPYRTNYCWFLAEPRPYATIARCKFLNHFNTRCINSCAKNHDFYNYYCFIRNFSLSFAKYFIRIMQSIHVVF
jgi:hypothetical protein